MMIFLLLGLEFTELETHCLKLARERVPHLRRFSQLLLQPEQFPGRISTARFSTTKLAVPGETRTARGDQEISAPAPAYEEAGEEADRTPRAPCRDTKTMTVRDEAEAGGGEDPGTLEVRSEARELQVSGR